MGIHRAAVSCAYPCRTNTDVANFQTLAAVLVKVKAWFVEAVARCPGTRQVPRNSRTETMLNTPMSDANYSYGCGWMPGCDPATGGLGTPRAGTGSTGGADAATTKGCTKAGG